MIAVLGPAPLADAIAAACAGELVVGAREDEALAAPPELAAWAAAELPLPARVVVIGSDRNIEIACPAVMAAGGALTGARVYVIGEPPGDTYPTVWIQDVERLGAVPALDIAELAILLGAAGTRGADPTPASPPSGPEATAWREWLGGGTARRLPWGRHRNGEIEGKVSEKKLDAEVRRDLGTGCRSIAVISPKGGVGKTLISFLLGSVLAQVRAARVVVVDTNPDFGTLADLVAERVPTTISDLLADLGSVATADQLDAYLTCTETGLRILAAPQGPAEARRVGSAGYLAVNPLLRRHFDLIIYDCGTSLLGEVGQFALRHADQVVLVSAPQLVTAKLILSAVDHLETTGFPLSRATMVINMGGHGDTLDRARLREVLAGRMGAIVDVPYDQRVQRDLDLGQFRYDRLAGRTRQAIKRLGASMMVRLPSGGSAAEVAG